MKLWPLFFCAIFVSKHRFDYRFVFRGHLPVCFDDVFDKLIIRELDLSKDVGKLLFAGEFGEHWLNTMLQPFSPDIINIADRRYNLIGDVPLCLFPFGYGGVGHTDFFAEIRLVHVQMQPQFFNSARNQSITPFLCLNNNAKNPLCQYFFKKLLTLSPEGNIISTVGKIS